MPYKYGVLILQPQIPKSLVWAIPVSLAATQGITRGVFHPSEASGERNTTRYCFLFLQVLRCFTSLG